MWGFDATCQWECDRIRWLMLWLMVRELWVQHGALDSMRLTAIFCIFHLNYTKRLSLQMGWGVLISSISTEAHFRKKKKNIVMTKHRSISYVLFGGLAHFYQIGESMRFNDLCSKFYWNCKNKLQQVQLLHVRENKQKIKKIGLVIIGNPIRK